MVDRLPKNPPTGKRKRSSPDTSPVGDGGNPPAKKPKVTSQSTPSITKARSTASPSNSRTKLKPSVRQNAEAGPSKQKHSTPARVSTRVSKPTEKKAALLSQVKKPTPSQVQLNDESDFDSDDTPPLYLTISSQPTKRKKIIPTDPTTKKSSLPIHLGAIEISSGSEDGPRSRPAKIKKTPAKVVSSSEIIDLCSSGDEKMPKKYVAPVRRPQPVDEVVEIVSTDDESGKQIPAEAPASPNVPEPDEVERQHSPPPPTPTPPPPRPAVEEPSETMLELPEENTLLPSSNQPPAQGSVETVVTARGVVPEHSDQDSAKIPLDSLQASYRASMETAKMKLPRFQFKKSAFSGPKPTKRSRPIVFADSLPSTSTPNLQTPLYFSRTLSASKKVAFRPRMNTESRPQATSVSTAGSSSGHTSPSVQSAAKSPPVETSGNIMTRHTTGLGHEAPSVAVLPPEKTHPDPSVSTLVKETPKPKTPLNIIFGIMKAEGYLPKESEEPRKPKEKKGKGKEKEPLFLPSDESKSGTPTPRRIPSVEPSSSVLTKTRGFGSSSSESLLEVADTVMLPAATLPPDSASVTPSTADDIACEFLDDMVCGSPIVDHFAGRSDVGMVSVHEAHTNAVNVVGPEVPQAVVENTFSDAIVCDTPPINNPKNQLPVVQNLAEGLGTNDTGDELRNKAITEIQRGVNLVNSNLKPPLEITTQAPVNQSPAPTNYPPQAFGNLSPSFVAGPAVTSTEPAAQAGTVTNANNDPKGATASDGKSPASTVDSASPATPSHSRIGSDILFWNLPPPRMIRSPEVSIFDFDMVTLKIPPITASMMYHDDDLDGLELGYPEDGQC